MTRRHFTFVTTTGSFILKRLGQNMEPESGNSMEIEGVLNPAAIRGLDDELYLLPQGKLFVYFCPMAFGGKGSYWISESKSIQNPYMVTRMPTYGEVKEEL